MDSQCDQSVGPGQTPTLPCPICQSPSPYALTKEDHPYYRCGQCEFLFHRSEKPRTGETLLQFYDEKYWTMERAEALRREKEESLQRALELIYISSITVENILDFGCGLGVTVKLLREKLGLNAVGIDLSVDFEETDYLHRCDLNELIRKYPAGYFDAIYSIEVFEHLEDPVGILSLLRRLLKPGGKILLNTGTQEYISKHDPEMTYIDPTRRGHISIYSLKSLSRLAATIDYTASYLADRPYLVILSPVAELPSFPLAQNLERFKNLGEWFPAFMREYMRLVFREAEFDERGAWAKLLEEGLETERRRYQQLQKEFDNRGQWALGLAGEVEKLRHLLEEQRQEAAMLHNAVWFHKNRLTRPLKSILRQLLRKLRRG